MRRAPSSLRSRPLVFAITATLGAAGLVLYLQYRAHAALRSQTELTLHQLSEQTAADVAVELRRILEGPVFDTLTAVNHPELRAGRLDLVAEHFDRGLGAYPHVDRFFAWHQQSERPADVMFYGRQGGFRRDGTLGPVLLDLARAHAPSQQIYIAAEGLGADGRQHVFLRLFWTDAARDEYFAILGFVVDGGSLHERLFRPPEGPRPLEEILRRRGGDAPLALRVLDEEGGLVHGPNLPGPIGGRVPFSMLFYPGDEIETRLAAGVAPRPWTIEVTTLHPSLTTVNHGYWLSALSVVLMLVALVLTLQAHRRSTDLARMQSDFVSHVSHQLKTPLSLLTAATETLQMDRVKSPERLAQYLDTIRAEAARLSSLVQRVLEFSRVHERRRYEFERVDLSHLARETLDAFAHGYPHRQFQCQTPAQAEGPFVLADSAALEQALANLLDNAVKYSDADAPVVVGVRADRAEAIVEVIDRGVGIDLADQAHIFERFYRGQNGTDRQGFGLGLPIVRELLQAHGGRVDVVSAPGDGSTFRLVLPRLPVMRSGTRRALEMTEAG